MSWNFDPRGVLRGKCSCNECDAYEMKEGMFPTCEYCGCSPVKHIVVGKTYFILIKKYSKCFPTYTTHKDTS